MKKATLTLILIACAFAGIAGTNDYYINLTGAEFDARESNITNILANYQTYGPTLTNNAAIIATNTATIATNNTLLLNLTNEVFSAGVSDCWFGEQTITNDFAETTMTDIDLSSWVGTNSSVVLIRAKADGIASTVLLRQNGETNTVDATSMSGTPITANEFGYMIVPTDTNGVIEADVTYSTDFTLMGFIRRHEFD